MVGTMVDLLVGTGVGIMVVTTADTMVGMGATMAGAITHTGATTHTGAITHFFGEVW